MPAVDSLGLYRNSQLVLALTLTRAVHIQERLGSVERSPMS